MKKINFDDFLHRKDLIEKYKKYREFFNQAETHDELEQLKYQLLQPDEDEDDENHIPKDILNFFYEERKNQLGPKIKYKDKTTTYISYSPDAISIAKALSDRTFYRPNI